MSIKTAPSALPASISSIKFVPKSEIDETGANGKFGGFFGSGGGFVGDDSRLF